MTPIAESTDTNNAVVEPEGKYYKYYKPQLNDRANRNTYSHKEKDLSSYNSPQKKHFRLSSYLSTPELKPSHQRQPSQSKDLKYNNKHNKILDNLRLKNVAKATVNINKNGIFLSKAAAKPEKLVKSPSTLFYRSEVVYSNEKKVPDSPISPLVQEINSMTKSFAKNRQRKPNTDFTLLSQKVMENGRKPRLDSHDSNRHSYGMPHIYARVNLGESYSSSQGSDMPTEPRGYKPTYRSYSIQSRDPEPPKKPVKLISIESELETSSRRSIFGIEKIDKNGSETVSF